MGAIYSRVKTWIDNEDLDFSDLNAEFDNILTNSVPLQFDDYSVNVAQMKLTTDPGELATESLATTLAGELERLRFMIAEVTGKTQWYESPSASIEELNQSIAVSGNKIVSGKSRSGSSQLVALDPDGTAATVVIRGASTSFVYKIEGIQYTVSTDVSLTSLQLASGDGTADECLVDDAGAADGLETKLDGENGTSITIDTAGTEITSAVGERATFRLVTGAGTEYFTAFIESTTSLTKCRRGYFFNTSDAPIDRIVYANNDAITLMKATWIFANTAGAIVASFLEPIYDVDQPTATNGRYWFDLANDKWKLGNGATFDDADATLIGETVQDDTGCVGARTHEIAVALNQVSTPELQFVDVTRVRTKLDSSTVSVFGNKIKIDHDFIRWDMDTDLDSGVSEAASTTYHLYLDEDGDAIISDVPPYDRRADLLGFYHPHQTWRSLGAIDNDGSSDFDTTTLSRKQDYVIGTNAVLRNNLVSVGEQIATTSGAFSSTSATYVTVTNQSFTLTTSGRPVVLYQVADSTTNPSGYRVGGFSEMRYKRDAVVIREDIDMSNSTPGPPMMAIDTPVAGTYIYSLQVRTSSGTVEVANIQLVAFEL